MTLRLRAHAAVEADIKAGRQAYEDLRPGLGDELVSEIHSTMTQLEEYPFLFQKRYGEFRVAISRRFRYKVIYRIDGETIYVIAVRHPRQHPTTWERRT